MILKIGNTKFDIYNNISVSLAYDGIASAFSFDLYFDPSDPLHRQVFRPCQYLPASVEHNGETLITGILLSHSFSSGAVRSIVSVSGYSKTGLLEDCEIPLSAYPLQSNGLTLKEIAERLCKPFGISVIVDSSVSSKVNAKYSTSIARDSDSVKQYLCELANQKHVILTHDALGNVVLTEANTKTTPIYDFASGMPGISYKLNVDGQKMHGNVSMIKQQSKRHKGNAGQATISNPYCPIFRPKVNRQTSGKDVDTQQAARNALSDELKGIPLTIELDRWELNGKLIKPNNIVTIKDPDLFLFNKTKFFIEKVDFKGDQNSQTAILTCYLPEVYNNDTPQNIFNK